MTYFTIYDPEEPVPFEANDREEKENEKSLSFEIKESEKRSVEIKEKPGRFKIALFWICGIESSLYEDTNKPKEVYKINTSIDESRFWSNICDLNAVIAMALCGFCYAFFNTFDD